ncbi:GDSL esterase/lipase-like [Dorcoceras hygrometricum]|uniref:GDSL esterase/lipase-like n=1 Tax=Dorcoceras hygrometricum TaxID=472368 RepID=A0A2Z7CUD9_9LAMI|nr:GDSL esterase/lipase-like [Dorcoceras hygrometricum]
MVSGSIYEEALTQFFVGALIISELNTVDGKDVVITQLMFAEVFEFSSEGAKSFNSIPTVEVEAMKVKFSLFGAPFKPSSKNKEMKVDYSLLNDIVTNLLLLRPDTLML